MWFLFLIPVMFAIANLTDKILVYGDEEDSDPLSLIAISGFFALILAIPLGLWIFFSGEQFPPDGVIIVLVANELLIVFAMWIYLKLLKNEETSRTVCWFQTIPIFGIIGAFIILQETPQWFDFLGIIALVIGGCLLSYQDGAINKGVIFGMLVSSAFIALNDVIFAYFGRTITPAGAIFVILIGKFFWGMCILVGEVERNGFFLGLNTKFKFQAVSEFITLSAYILTGWAILFYPVANVQGILASQPLFVLIGATILMMLAPDIFQEETGGMAFRIKVIAITMMIAGGILLA